MKISDKIRLMLLEWKKGVSEGVLSILLQLCIFTVILVSFTVAIQLDSAIGSYFTASEDGIGFYIVGYSDANDPELKRFGFYDIEIGEDGEGYACLSDLKHIWLKKIVAVVNGHDIWNSELDELLNFILFCQLSFFALGIVMLVMMLNNNTSSLALRLLQRERYITMLSQLGCKMRDCRQIFFWLFITRSMLAFAAACGLSAGCLALMNQICEKNFGVTRVFSVSYLPVLLALALSYAILFLAEFEKKWRKTV